MGLDDYTGPDEGSEGGSSSSEVSEVFKEAVKKASSGIKRTKKDEKKAKKHDLLLANFLVKIILDKKYDILLDDLFDLTKAGYSSNFILGIISLVYIDISHSIREELKKDSISFDYKSEVTIEFDDSKLNEDIKNRINHWVEDMIDVISFDYSSLDTIKLIELLKTDENIVNFIAKVFAFFLKESKIMIKHDESVNITGFILQEVFKKLKSLNIEEI